jgi:hypothetical protein
VVRGKHFDVFLQGSYRNATNIRGDSDVDIVVELNETVTWDTSRLPVEQQKLRAASRVPATYTWGRFRADTLASLRAYFGGDRVREGNKAIKVLAAHDRLNADVIVAVTHLKYNLFLAEAVETHEEGIQFWDRQNRPIVNLPKQHIRNGQDKNSRTGSRYKPAVRVFKNARRHLVERGKITRDLAPSYFVECFIYNAPDNLFVPDVYFIGMWQTIFRRIVEYLRSAKKGNFISQSGLVPLFGPTPEQWDEWRADMLVDALIDLWNEWK